MPEYPKKVTILADTLNIRSGPGSQYGIIGSTSKGKIWFVDGVEKVGSNLWYWIGNAKKVWLAAWWTKAI